MADKSQLLVKDFFTKIIPDEWDKRAEVKKSEGEESEIEEGGVEESEIIWVR